MKITDVELIQALHWPFVRIHTDAGISGIGEASLQQKELAVRAEVMAYRDFLIGQNPFEIERIWNALHRRTVWSGGPVTMTAISGIEQALWDIKGKAAGMPVYELLGAVYGIGSRPMPTAGLGTPARQRSMRPKPPLWLPKDTRPSSGIPLAIRRRWSPERKKNMR